MSVHWNSDQVVGGIEGPRFLVVGPELSPNVSFEEGLTGVGGSAGAYSQDFDATTPFLDYVLTIEDDDAGSQEYAELTIDAGETIASKRFISFTYGRADSAAQQPIWTDWLQSSGAMPSGDHTKQFVLDGIWRRRIVHEIVVPAAAANNTLKYRIYPSGKAGGAANTGAIRVDDFHVRRVLGEYVLPLPTRGQQTEIFRMIRQAEHELLDGSLKTYKKGFRYYYEGGYEKISAAFEVVRAQLATTDYEILFFPHRDANLCYLVKWADDYERKWAFGTAALGHEAQIQLIGQEILHIIPTEIYDALNQYEYPDDSFIVSSDQQSVTIIQ